MYLCCHYVQVCQFQKIRDKYNYISFTELPTIYWGLPVIKKQDGACCEENTV